MRLTNEVRKLTEKERYPIMFNLNKAIIEDLKRIGDQEAVLKHHEQMCKADIKYIIDHGCFTKMLPRMLYKLWRIKTFKYQMDVRYL